MKRLLGYYGTWCTCLFDLYTDVREHSIDSLKCKKNNTINSVQNNDMSSATGNLTSSRLLFFRERKRHRWQNEIQRQRLLTADA